MATPPREDRNENWGERFIDLPLLDVSKDTDETGTAIVEAAMHYGFFWIDNSPSSETPIPGALVDRMFGMSRRFFTKATPEQKAECVVEGNYGYVEMQAESLDPQNQRRGDFKELFDLLGPNIKTGEYNQPLPRIFIEEAASLQDFISDCRVLGTRLLRLLARGLRIDDVDWFVNRHLNFTSNMRFLHYPGLAPDSDYDNALDIRAGAHSDYGSLTLLFTRPGQPGLQILDKDNAWRTVPVAPASYGSPNFPPIVVNIGDILSYWTNGILRSTVHRVVLINADVSHENAGRREEDNEQRGVGQDRFSIAYFMDPDETIHLEPCPSPIVATKGKMDGSKMVGRGGGSATAAEMVGFTAGDFIAARLKAGSLKAI